MLNKPFTPANLPGLANGGRLLLSAARSRYWQELARTIPAREGDPVAVWESAGGTLIQPAASKRPILQGGVLVFDGVDDNMFLEPLFPDHAVDG